MKTFLLHLASVCRMPRRWPIAIALGLGCTVLLHADKWGPFTYRLDGDSLTITGYDGTESSVTIPESIEGRPVTAVTAYAFSYPSTVTHIHLPSTVVDAGNPPVALAGSIQNLSVAEGNPVFSSRDGVLFNRDQTRLVRVPSAWPGATFVVADKVIRIDGEAFSQCRNLKRIVLPRGLAEVGEAAFSSCPGLTDFEVEDGNPVFRSVGGVLFDGRGDTLIQYPQGRAGPYTVPDGVTAIGASAFADCDGLSAIELPAGLTRIGPWAFRSCEGLWHVTIPDKVETIAEGSFHQAGLATVLVGRGVTLIGDSAFDNRRGHCGGWPCYGPSHTVGARIDLLFTGTVPLAVYPFGDRARFWGWYDESQPPRVFRLAGAPGWGSTFGGVDVTSWGGEPMIHHGPYSTTTYAGRRVELTAKAVGPAPIRYQWLQGEQEVPGATNAVLSLSPLRAGHAGSWQLRASNAFGSVTSEVASITVYVPRPGGYAAAALSLGPIAYWPLDGADVSPVVDVTNGGAEEISGSGFRQVSGATPNTGQGIALNGSASIRTWRSPSRGIGTGDFTVAAWIRPSAYAQAGIVSKGGYSWTHGWLFDFNAAGQGSLRLETSMGNPGGQGTVQTLPGVVTLDEWQHVVVSCRRDPQAGSGLNTTGKGWTKIYRNGVQVASGDIGPGNLDNHNLPLTLGGISNAAGSSELYGQVDEVALFDRALSPEQVADLFAAGFGTAPPLRLTRSIDRVILTWVEGVLQTRTALDGGIAGPAWMDLPDAPSPYLLEPSEDTALFRVRTP